MKTINIGDKVHHIKTGQNGMVKELQPNGKEAIVVFHCCNDWENYWRFRGVTIWIKHLRPGWIEKVKPHERFNLN